MFAQRYHYCCRGTETACVQDRTCNVAKSPDLALQFQQTAASVDHFAWGKSDDGGSLGSGAAVRSTTLGTTRRVSQPIISVREKKRDWPLPQQQPFVIGCAPDPSGLPPWPGFGEGKAAGACEMKCSQRDGWERGAKASPLTRRLWCGACRRTRADAAASSLVDFGANPTGCC